MKPTKEQIATARHIGDSVLSTAREADYMNYDVEDLISDLEGHAKEIQDFIIELREYEHQLLTGEKPELLQEAFAAWDQMTPRQKSLFLEKAGKR